MLRIDILAYVNSNIWIMLDLVFIGHFSLYFGTFLFCFLHTFIINKCYSPGLFRKSTNKMSFHILRHCCNDFLLLSRLVFLWLETISTSWEPLLWVCFVSRIILLKDCEIFFQELLPDLQSVSLKCPLSALLLSTANLETTALVTIRQKICFSVFSIRIPEYEAIEISHGPLRSSRSGKHPEHLVCVWFVGSVICAPGTTIGGTWNFQ